MKTQKNKHLGLRIDYDSLQKLHYISNFEGRSSNGQLLYLIRKCIEEFENENGAIQFENE
jgi:hypothetical protein